MKVYVAAVWPFHRADKTLHHATVIVRDERGKKYVLVTTNQFVAERCRQLERPSSTLEPPAKPVDILWDVDHRIVEIQEAA